MEPETFKHAICCFLFVCLFVCFGCCFLCMNACMDVECKPVIKIWVPWPVKCNRTSISIPK